MRRRLATLLSAALLGAALLLPLTALPALGATGVADGTIVLATEASAEGLEPMEPDASENEFAPPQYEANWTWRAGTYLLGLIVLVVGYVGLSYYLRVARPRSKNQQS